MKTTTQISEEDLLYLRKIIEIGKDFGFSSFANLPKTQQECILAQCFARKMLFFLNKNTDFKFHAKKSVIWIERTTKVTVSRSKKRPEAFEDSEEIRVTKSYTVVEPAIILQNFSLENYILAFELTIRNASDNNFLISKMPEKLFNNEVYNMDPQYSFQEQKLPNSQQEWLNILEGPLTKLKEPLGSNQILSLFTNQLHDQKLTPYLGKEVVFLAKMYEQIATFFPLFASLDPKDQISILDNIITTHSSTLFYSTYAKKIFYSLEKYQYDENRSLISEFVFYEKHYDLIAEIRRDRKIGKNVVERKSLIRLDYEYEVYGAKMRTSFLPVDMWNLLIHKVPLNES